MHRALTVIVAALVMSALVLGAALDVEAFEDSSVATTQAQARLGLLQDVSSAYELSLRSASLAFLDSYAENLSLLPASDGYALSLSEGLERALGNLSFAATCSVDVLSVSVVVSRGGDGALRADLYVDYIVADGAGDSIDVSYSVTLRHGLKLLAASSLVSAQHTRSLSLLSSLEGASLQDLSSLNGSYVDGESGLTVVTRLLALRPGAVELLTSVQDGGSCDVLDGRYSYVVELNSTVALDWAQ
jgi:hypothetical protein